MREMRERRQSEVSVEDYRRLRETKARHVLLDVREEHEWRVARIEGARLLPLSRLAREGAAALPADLTPDSHIVVHCHHGLRSAQVTAWLRQLGFEQAFNLAGGIDDWSRRVDAAVPRY